MTLELEAPALGAGYGIAAVERDCGIPKDTLRVWERRYGFPSPQRDENGERLYSASDVARLRLIRRLIDAGRRPSRIVTLPLAQLERMLQPAGAALAMNAEVSECLGILKSNRPDLVREFLRTRMLRAGLTTFVAQIAAPLARGVGEGWSRGEIRIHHEHMFTEELTNLLRRATYDLSIAASGSGPQTPRVLLTTLPREPHALGLLMAESLLAADGCATVSLGVQTPIEEIVAAVADYDCDVLALSFSPCMTNQQVSEGLKDLRAALPAEVAIWAGGSCPGLTRGVAEGVNVFGGLDGISPAVAAWRATHAAADLTG